MKNNLVKQKYTEKELLNKLKQFYNTYHKVPTTRDLKGNKEYPHPEIYRIYFGSHKSALIKAGLYNLRKDKHLFDRHTYSKDEVINLVKIFIDDYHRIPTYEDLKNNLNLPSGNTIDRLFINLNELIKATGNYPIHNCVYKPTNNELINSLQKLYKELGRTPTSRDVKDCSYTFGDNTYITHFGSFYKSLEAANIPYNKRTKFYSDDEIIQIWYALKNKLNRIPTIEEMRDQEIDVSHSIHMRWKNYSSFLKVIGEDSNYNYYGCKTYYTINGTKCLSTLELKLTQFLEDNNIEFKKDYPYKNIFKDDNTTRTLDWMISYNNNTYYVELFGILGSEIYENRKARKIADFKKNKLRLIELYPDKIRYKSPKEILSFLNLQAA